MRQISNENQFAEILIFRKQHAILLQSYLHQSVVAGARIDCQRRNDIVALAS